MDEIVRECPIGPARCVSLERMEFLPGVPHYLGFGLTHPLALEGVLKFKEITYALSADLSKTLTVD